MLTGSPGLGRTRLLRELGARLRVESIDSLYVLFIQPSHTLLVSIATRLSLRVVKDSSVALRGLLCNALEDHRRVLLLDDIAEASSQFYRFFERVLHIPGPRLVSAERTHWGDTVIIGRKLLKLFSPNSRR